MRDVSLQSIKHEKLAKALILATVCCLSKVIWKLLSTLKLFHSFTLNLTSATLDFWKTDLVYSKDMIAKSIYT